MKKLPIVLFGAAFAVIVTVIAMFVIINNNTVDLRIVKDASYFFGLLCGR